jgi:hypothetical protein
MGEQQALQGDRGTATQQVGDLVYRSKIRMIRTIATREGLQIKDVIGAAFTKAVRSYERKHGPIEGDGKTNLKDLF